MKKHVALMVVMAMLVMVLVGCTRRVDQPSAAVAQPVEKSETDFEKAKKWFEEQESNRQKKAAKELQEKQQALDDLKKREDELVDKVAKKVLAPLQAEREADTKAKKEAEEAKVALEKIVGPLIEQLKALHQRIEALEKSKGKPKEKAIASGVVVVSQPGVPTAILMQANVELNKLMTRIIRNEFWQKMNQIALEGIKENEGARANTASITARAANFQKDVEQENKERKAQGKKPLGVEFLKSVKASDDWAVINSKQRQWQLENRAAELTKQHTWYEAQLEYQRRLNEARLRIYGAPSQLSKHHH